MLHTANDKDSRDPAADPAASGWISGILAPCLLWICGAGIFIFLLVAGGCDQVSPISAPQTRPPTIELVQQSDRTLQVRIAGPEGLRALQMKLVYDSGAARVEAVEAGADVLRLDRVFWSDLERHAGALVLGLADTRRVKLPARGTLLSLTVAAQVGARLRLTEIVGVREGGQRVAIADAELELGR